MAFAIRPNRTKIDGVLCPVFLVYQNSDRKPTIAALWVYAESSKSFELRRPIMKRITIFVLLIALFAIVSPAHAQADCTPPAGAQIIATNVNGQYTAWAIGNSVSWCGNGTITTTYESTYIDTLYFDAYWLPYNLYFGYSVDGYLFQMNVSTGQGHLIRQHGTPPGDEGGIGGNGAPQSQPEPETVGINPSSEPSPTPVIHVRPVKPLVIRGFDILKLWQ